MEKKQVAKKTKSGILWSFFLQGFQYFSRFVNSIILAKLLFPQDFGLMGIAMMILQFSRRLTSFGFTMVLIQREDVKREHYDTVFLSNFVLIGIVSLCISTFNEKIANFFHNPHLSSILYLISIIFLVESLSSVQIAILKRKLMFKELGIVNILGSFSSVIVSAGLAFFGAGVWALVIGNFAGALVKILASIYYTKWIPHFQFRFWALKDVFYFGLWVYFAGYIRYAINNVDFFVIGKFLNATQLGFYERAFNLMSLPRKRLVEKINTVLFAAYSRFQDDDELLVKALKRVIANLSVMIYPFMIWLFFASPSFIRLVYGEKWINTIYPLQIMCINGLVDSFTMMFQPLLTAKGWFGNHTRREFLFLVVLTMSVVLGLHFGINGVAWGVTAASFFRLILMLHLTISKMKFSILDFLSAQRSAIIYSGVQIGTIIFFNFIYNIFYPKMSIAHLVGVSFISVISIVGSHLIFRFPDVNEPIEEIAKNIKKIINKYANTETAK